MSFLNNESRVLCSSCDKEKKVKTSSLWWIINYSLYMREKLIRTKWPRWPDSPRNPLFRNTYASSSRVGVSGCSKIRASSLYYTAPYHATHRLLFRLLMLPPSRALGPFLLRGFILLWLLICRLSCAVYWNTIYFKWVLLNLRIQYEFNIRPRNVSWNMFPLRSKSMI